jgi:hypothetical protein
MVLLPNSLFNLEQNAAETTVVQNMNTLHFAEQMYAGRTGAYANAFEDLKPLLQGDLATGRTGGYQFSVERSEGGYIIRASPQPPGRGKRSFWSDQSRTLKLQ